MIIIITGASHTGKTVLAQRLLEKYQYPYLSVDHLKMGLIRSGNTKLTPMDSDEELTTYLWPIVREMINTAIENEQNMIVEGCYIPFDWRKDFIEEYQKSIRFICLAMTDEYIDKNFNDILTHESDVEKRMSEGDFTVEYIKEENRYFIDGFANSGEQVLLIEDNYRKTIDQLL